MQLLTQLEHSELLDHFEQSSDIWMQSDENPSLWLRSDDSGPLCAVQFVPADPVVHVSGVPIAWTLEEMDAYLERLLEHWTSFLHRKSVEAFLRDELHVDADTAELSAIALSQLAVPSPKGLAPDLPEIPVQTPPGEIGLFQIVGGGYVLLRMRDDLLHATLSVPSNRQHSSFGPPFTSVFRTHSMHTKNAAGFASQENPE